MEKCRFKPSDSPVLNDGVTVSVFGQGELLRRTCTGTEEKITWILSFFAARKAPRRSPAIRKHTWLVSMESNIINTVTVTAEACKGFSFVT